MVRKWKSFESRQRERLKVEGQLNINLNDRSLWFKAINIRKAINFALSNYHRTDFES